jgi:DNA-binding NarL/FixJ family response regulator
MRILIFGKADTLRNGFQTLLTALSPGEKIDIVEDAAQLADRFENHAYDLAFLYPNLPFPTLLAAVFFIKKSSPHVRAVMVIEDPKQETAALQAGADQVLLKGFSGAQLIRLLEELTAKPTEP